MRLEEIVKDLFNLEVNLIESRDITGRKMDSVSIGMAQIANKYAVYLSDDLFEDCLSASLEPGGYSVGSAPAAGLATHRDLVLRIVGQSDSEYTKATFDDLATLAEYVIEHGDFQHHAEELGVVVRIRGVSHQLRFLADRWGGHTFIGKSEDGTDRDDPESLTAADRLQIRKAWEVGTSVLLMQTVTQLDGDTVTRVSSDRLSRAEGPAPPNRPGRPPSDPDLLFQLHRQLVDTALNNWRTLFETVAKLAGRALSSFFK